MSTICNSIISCFGCCPWVGLEEEYTTQVRAPNGYYVPVDHFRQTQFYIPHSDADVTINSNDERADPRQDIYLTDSIERHKWKAVKGFDYEKYGFVLTRIGWAFPNSTVAKDHSRLVFSGSWSWMVCKKCTWSDTLLRGCKHQ